MNAPSIGLVSIDAAGHWPGGRYYLHHLVRSVALLPEDERPPMRDVWWLRKDKTDTSFEEIRHLLAPSAIVHPPEGVIARIARRLNVLLGRQSRDFRDLFEAAGVCVLFPTSACEQAGVPLVYWLTDFQYKRRPDLYTPDLLAWFETNCARKVAQAELVVLSSMDALSDFERYFPQYAEKARLLRFTSLPQPEWFDLDSTTTARAKGLHPTYFMISNQLTAHKNHLAVFEAVRRLKTRGVEIKLACSGKAMDYKGGDYAARLRRFVQDHDLADSIHLLGFLSRTEQMALFRGACAILQPSCFEGWSTPVEDAKSLGRPLIVSDIPVHREQLQGFGGVFVDADDVEAWADALCAAQVSSPPDATTEALAIDYARRRAAATARAFVEIMQEAVLRAQARRS